MPYDGSGLDETTKAVLLEARRLVEEGWCQGTYEDDAGRVCLNRALMLGSVGTRLGMTGPEWRAAYLRLDVMIAAQYGIDPRTSGSKLERWNDAPERTHAEVLELLDRAIAGGDAEP